MTKSWMSRGWRERFFPVVGASVFALSVGCFGGDGPDVEGNNDTVNNGGVNNGGVNNGGMNNGGDEFDCDTNLRPLVSADVKDGGTLEAGSCYKVERVLTVGNGTLNIEPGVKLVFHEDAGLSVTTNGALNARGTEEEPILMHGLDARRGYWRGLMFNETRSSENILEHVVLEGAGSSKWHGGGQSVAGVFIWSRDVSLRIKNSVIRGTAAPAFVALESSSSIVFEDNVIEDNDAAMWVHGAYVGQIKPGNVFQNNDDEHILVGYTGTNSRFEEATWYDHGVPYRIRVDMVFSGTLTLSPGVELRFEQDVGINVQDTGRLKAVGTEDAPIVLTGADDRPAFWKGIQYLDTRSSDNVLNHVVLENAGSRKWHGGDSSRGGIFVYGGGVALDIRNSVFRGNGQAGIVVDHRDSEVTIASSHFERNDVPMWLTHNNVGKVENNNTFADNAASFVRVGGFTSGKGVTSDATWHKHDVPYEIVDVVGVPAKLTIAPGTKLVFRQDAGLHIDGGTLTARSPDAEPILFTGEEQLRGYWRGIYFFNSLSSDNVLENVIVEWGGSRGWHGGEDSVANIFVAGRNDVGQVQLDDVTIRGSKRYGLSVENGGRVVSCTGIVFENNELANFNSPASNASNICDGTPIEG